MTYKDCLLISSFCVKRYIKNGRLHRLNGPAVINSSNKKWWYYNGMLVKCNSQEEFERYIKLMILL
jgi:hypothetical protein